MTLEEFQASKKTGALKKAEARKPEEVKGKQIEKVATEKEKVSTIDSRIGGNELYNAGTAKSEFANLLGFQEGGDDYEGGEFRERRGRGGRGRGDRGGRGGYRGGDRDRGGYREGGARRGGRGKLGGVDDFPTLS